MTQFFKNILHGMGSVLDLFPQGSHRNFYIIRHKSESDALRQDWERVGGYLWSGVERAKSHVEEKEETELAEKH